ASPAPGPAPPPPRSLHTHPGPPRPPATPPSRPAHAPRRHPRHSPPPRSPRPGTPRPCREDARGCAEETGGGSDSPAGRGGPGRAGEGRGRRRWGRGPGRGRGGAGAGLAEPGSPGPRPPDAPTMSRFRAALRATRPETISDNCVVIFSKTSCSYCTMAKKLFHDMNVKYKVVELDMLEYGSQFQDALYKMTGERTVPRIFINGTFIGGATDTHRLHKEGKLLPLVHQCYLKKSKRKEF
uniref:Glutaredoxin-2, mitochondrial n=1 Tax=Canis lupus familiaris TaxID=9615 RepID=A0A8I3PJB8_CANLF